MDVYAAAADQADQARDASASSQAEFQTLVTIWTELLTALVPQLERLGSRLSNPGISPVLVSGSTSTTSISTSEEDVFWELWNFLFFASDAYALARDLLPALWESKGPERFNPSLFAAYHWLLVWLSHMSQTSTAWRLMGTEHGLGERNESLVNILTNPAQDLLIVSCMIPPAVVHHLSSMPHNFVPLLCSIASGQIGMAPILLQTPPCTAEPTKAATTYTSALKDHNVFDASKSLDTFLTLLNVTVHNLVRNDLSMGEDGRCSFLSAPAVLHFLNLTLIRQAEPPPKPTALQLARLAANDLTPKGPSEIALTYNTARCLMHLLNPQHMQPQPRRQLSALEQRANCDSAGLPVHLNPFESRRVLETDVAVLRSARLHCQQKASLTPMLFEIQGLVVQGWISSWEAADLSAASQGDDSFREALLVMAGSVVGLARQCSGHGVEFLQHLQQQQLRRQSSRAGRSGKKPGQPQRPQDLLAGEQVPQHSGVHTGVWDADGVSRIRGLVLVVSGYRGRFLGSKVQRSLGE